jgi:1-acyl-sn-glycerol-3-phosphate acyltransferase
LNLRRAWRALALVATLIACVVRYRLACLSGPRSFAQHAQWLQDSCRVVLRRMGVHLNVTGLPPTQGIVVSNHLSYLDIAVLGAIVPVCFVSKAEVQRWPLFGTLARTGGTIFLDRASLSGAMQVASQIAERIAEPIPVIVFPEGTTSDGSSVLRFHSLLLEPAIRVGKPVTAVAVRYLPPRIYEEREVCWYGDDGFLLHIWKVLGMEKLTAAIRFAPPRIFSDRRSAAAVTHAEVMAMRMSGAKESDPV